MEYGGQLYCAWHDTTGVWPVTSFPLFIYVYISEFSKYVTKQVRILTELRYNKHERPALGL